MKDLDRESGFSWQGDWGTTNSWGCPQSTNDSEWGCWCNDTDGVPGTAVSVFEHTEWQDSKTEVDRRWSPLAGHTIQVPQSFRVIANMASFTNGTQSEHNWCNCMSQVSNGSNWWDATGAHWQSWKQWSSEVIWEQQIKDLDRKSGFSWQSAWQTNLPLEKKITQTEWTGIINLIFAVWGAAKAACLLKIPESMPERRKYGDCSDLAKKLRNIAGAATIRATGMKDGKPATESEMRDARDWWWPFPYHARPGNGMLPVEA